MQQPSSSGSQELPLLPAEQHLRAQLELLQNHDADTSTVTGSRDSRGAISHSPSPRTANGYQELAAASHEAVRALNKTQPEAHIHPDLRGAAEHATNMMSLDPPSGHSPSASPTGHPHTMIAQAPHSSAPEASSIGEGRKAKRELSQSKRAAQNRAAQRAFRQRKEGYIKKLEQQVRELADMEETFKAIQTENHDLRNYVLHLQSRLLSTQGEFPPPPPSINLSPVAPQPRARTPEQAPTAEVGTPLEAVAQAVAGLAAQAQLAQSEQQHQERYPPSPGYKHEPREEDARSSDEINRQFHQHDEDRAGRPAHA
ncbi:hypothetical protein QQS21_003510 [Conoideocrella luteorostrata]|uniref:Putative transcription factor kapC n=1 Tax=Conoideocrella luteorostrata TaxID=1105319 RepID=A0AAJ0CW19_9HYPO|nr:hypothetical protein QQS21_003510 [Conoideocrella luteorostrata]